MEYMLANYPAHLSLDVSTDNAQAIGFYHRLGLVIDRTYITEEEKGEFAAFVTPEDFVYVPRVYTKVAVPQDTTNDVVIKPSVLKLEQTVMTNGEEIKTELDNLKVQDTCTDVSPLALSKNCSVLTDATETAAIKSDQQTDSKTSHLTKSVANSDDETTSSASEKNEPNTEANAEITETL